MNCENSCVMCEKCLESGSRSQVKIEEEGVKVIEEETFSLYPGGSYCKSSKSRPASGLEKVINDYKCAGNGIVYQNILLIMNVTTI